MATRARVRSGLDRRDLEILDIIQREGRIATKALARSVGLSLTPCFERVQRLQREGYIRAYRGILDARRLGPIIWIHTEFTLERHRDSDFARFERSMHEIPEVFECDAVGGGIDYIVRFVVPDIAHYQQLIDRLLESDLGVRTYTTHIVTKRIKEGVAIPLTVLASAPAADRR